MEHKCSAILLILPFSTVKQLGDARYKVYDTTKLEISLNMESAFEKKLGQGGSKFTMCVLSRASHTKLEKIMKELDEEVKFFSSLL